MFIKIVPILLVVFIIMILVNIYFTKERIGKYLGEKSGIRGWVYAIISGILVSGPPYVLFPLLGEFKKQGMKNSLLAVFLYNRNVKIPFLPVMIYYFGLGFTLILSLYIIIFSILNGKIIKLLIKDRF
ncbi:MAG: permease [Patescibacteria group bacterium]